MFEEIFKQVEQAKEDLKQSLETFEKDCAEIRESLDADIESFKERAKGDMTALDADIERSFGDFRSDLDSELDSKTSKLSEQAKQVEAFLEVKTEVFYSHVMVTLDKILEDQERIARNRAVKEFETSLEQAFEKNLDKLTPLIFKALVKHLFGFLKGKNK